MSASEILGIAVALAIAGGVGGVLAGLLGVGGGIVTVPILVEVFDFIDVAEPVQMPLSVGTSLAIIIPTAISSARAHHREGAVDVATVRSWGPGIALGALVGAWLGGRAGGALMSAVFALVCLVVAANMVLRSRGQAIWSALPKYPWDRIVTVTIGAVSAVMGIGGGTLSVPTLTACGMPIRKAVATSAALGLLIGVPAALAYTAVGYGRSDLPPFSLGYVSLPGAVLILPTSMLCAPVGARLAHSITPRVLSIAFGMFLLVSALRMGYRALA